MKKIKTTEEIAAEAAAKAARAEKGPAKPSTVIKTITEAALNMPGEEDIRNRPYVNKDTIEWELATRLTNTFEGFEFGKVDGGKILGIVAAMIDEMAVIAMNNKVGIDFGLAGSSFKLEYKPAKEANDIILLQEVAAQKKIAREAGVPEADLDAVPAVAEALEAYRNSSVIRPEHVTIKYSKTMIEKDGELVKK